MVIKCFRCKTENRQEHRYCCECGVVLTGAASLLKESLLKPGEKSRMLKFSFVFQINNMVDRGIEAYKKIIDSHPRWPDMRFKLANIYEIKGFTGKAISEYKEALSINPRYREARRCIGELYLKEGFYEEALKELNELLLIKL